MTVDQRVKAVEKRILSGYETMIFPPDLRAFVDQQEWTFAKTYASTWPHEYIMRDHVGEHLFTRLVQHIRTFGHEESFYSKRFIYYHEAGMVYWTMGEPIKETTIVNRYKKEQTYEYRLMHRTLPESRATRAQEDAPQDGDTTGEARDSHLLLCQRRRIGVKTGGMPILAGAMAVGCAHHITRRGNNREDVFMIDDDRRAARWAATPS